MKIPIYQVDAFTSDIFKGNPAAVCPLKEWIPDQIMQSIAMENNLSETAFYIENNEEHHIRWFTPKAEMDLAGHPTLASAHIILREFNTDKKNLIFKTQISRTPRKFYRLLNVWRTPQQYNKKSVKFDQGLDFLNVWRGKSKKKS